MLFAAGKVGAAAAAPLLEPREHGVDTLKRPALRRRQSGEDEIFLAAKPNQAVQAQQGFITDSKIVLMTGSTSSAVAVALNKLAEREKVLYAVAISGSNDIAALNFELSQKKNINTAIPIIKSRGAPASLWAISRRSAA